MSFYLYGSGYTKKTQVSLDTVATGILSAFPVISNATMETEAGGLLTASLPVSDVTSAGDADSFSMSLLLGLTDAELITEAVYARWVTSEEYESLLTYYPEYETP